MPGSRRDSALPRRLAAGLAHGLRGARLRVIRSVLEVQRYATAAPAARRRAPRRRLRSLRRGSGRVDILAAEALRRIRTSPCRADALECQEATDRVAIAGRGTCFDEPVDIPAWFVIAEFLCSLIRQAARSPTKGLTQLLAAVSVYWPIPLQGAPGARIERLEVEDRQTLLGAVQRMMRLDRNVLHRALKTAGISRQGLLGGRRGLPEALRGAMPALPNRPAPRQHRRQQRPRGPRPRHEVRQMMRRLERKLERSGQ